MNYSRLAAGALRGSVGLALAVVAACNQDPEAAKRKFLASGEAYMAQRNYSAAIIEYRNAVQQDAQFGEARFKLSLAYAQSGDTLSAMREAVRAADLMPERIDVQMQAATLLVVTRRFADARSRAEQVLQKDPGNVQAQVVLGNALAGTKDLDGAIREIEEALRLDPQRSTTYTNLGALEAARGDLGAAEKAFRQAVARDPKSAHVRLSLAQFYWLTARTAEAEQAIKEALALSPGDAVANRVMALFYLSTNRRPEAEPFLKASAEASGSGQGKLALADYYLVGERPNEATPILTALTSDPAVGTMARLRLAEIDQQAGRRDAAERVIDSVLSKEPGNLEALLAKAGLRLLDRSFDSALAFVERAVAANPTSALAHFARGKVLLAKQQPEEAKKAFNEAVRLNPRAAAAHVELARLHLQAGAAETSVGLASEALKMDPHSGDARFVLARGLMARGQLDEAEGLLKDLVAARPASALLHAHMGLLYAARNNPPAASAEFERALALDPLQLEAVSGLVAFDLSRKDQAGARQRVDALVLKAPRNADILTLAARTHMMIDDVAGAEPLLLKAIASNTSAMGAYSLLGSVYIRLGRLDEARRQFEQLADRQSHAASALTMAGILHQMQGRTAEAQRAFERVISIDPRAAVAANNLAWIYSENGGNLDVALQLAQTAKSVLPEQPEVDDTLGWIYYKKELLPLAITSLTLSVDRDPLNPVTQFHLGMAYAKSGDKIRAKHALSSALRLRPDFEQAAEASRVLASL